MAMHEALGKTRVGRRKLLTLASGAAAASVMGSRGLAGASTLRAHTLANYNQAAGFGELVPDPKGRLALPPGFQYRELSAEGSTLSNGAAVPSWHDGMAAFAGPNGTTVLVRNHEIGYEPADDPTIIGVPGERPYDTNLWGGTTAVVVDADRNEVESYVTSSGTVWNCAGGASLWGTWLTCEETTSQLLLDEDGFSSDLPHGYVFEIDPSDPENELSRTPIKDMGVFSHEAVAFDPETGYIYLTEDGETEADDFDPSKDTGGSFLFRFIPKDLSRKPGALQQGGTLQALKAVELPAANDADLLNSGQTLGVTWVDIVPEDATADAHGKDCLRFNRLEGAHFAGGAFWFCDTNGGEHRLGQIFRYIPASNTLELFYEGEDGAGVLDGSDAGRDYARLESPDNLTVTPWGDVLVAEDGGGVNRLIGFTPEGESYVFALHNIPYPLLEEEGLPDNFVSEVAGPTFSPDGQTLFFNIQSPGVTFAVWGPFKAPSAARQQMMSYAAPTGRFAPFISDDLRIAAEKTGLSTLQAAALHRLKVPVL